ncbi:unnamed protein product [Sphenostylis stenocarpa]|uniref:Uncharacterized protein n=1 Tax=Sphenostylis stenocarpa TaxID=92480 RepID=A0AA86V5F7_9FABA|nr:unnamed protein product [Sphenostylis stenocarpa]
MKKLWWGPGVECGECLIDTFLLNGLEIVGKSVIGGVRNRRKRRMSCYNFQLTHRGVKEEIMARINNDSIFPLLR